MAFRNTLLGEGSPSSPTDKEKPQSDHVETEDQENKPAADHTGTRHKTNPDEIRLVRSIDWKMMPILWLMYWLNYLDRNAITVARLDSLEQDLNLTSTQYQSCVSILFVGYILGQIPSNMLLTRVRPSLFMSGAMCLWAVVSALTAEIATRISILFTGSICGTAFAGLIAIGIYKLSEHTSLAGWRLLFIVQGAVTLLVSAVGCFILPDEPLHTKWLSPDQRQLAHDRIARDTVQIRENTAAWTGLLEACKDVRLWVLVFAQHFHMAASNYKNFFPTIVSTLGFSRNTTLALTCPPYLIAGIVSILYSLNSGRMNERTWHITFSKVLAVTGFVVACTTLNVGARYFAMCTFATGVYCCNSIILGWVATTCGQTKEKKAAAMALVNSSASISLIYTAYLWPSWDSPRYTIAMTTSAAFSATSALLAWVLKAMLTRENRKIRQSESEETMFYPT
ncbi:putative transporter [Colletotrichum siamense]|nr:putative transporter [Colletotrichum siamense]